MPPETLTIDRPAPSPPVGTGVAPPPELRAARRGELEQVRLVRSQAIGLPPEHWPSLAGLSDAALERVRVVAAEGRIVSTLAIRDAPVRIGDAVLPMGGISEVATLPEERNRGHASALMRDTLRELSRLGYCTSILFPFSFRYYRKFGYELAGNHCQFWCRPHNLPSFAEHCHVRPATPADIASLDAIYCEASRRKACALVRSTERWAELVGGDAFHTVVFDRDAPAGYGVLRDSEDQYGGRLLVVEELSFLSAEARRGMIGHLSRYSGEAIEWCAPPTDLAESGVLRSVAPLREGYKPRGIATVRPMFQFRVVDVLAALKARAPVYAGLRGELSLLLRDDILPQNARPVAISARDGTVQILADHRTEHWLEADIRAFSQVFCGYVSPAEAVSQGLVQVSDPEAVNVAEDFFPRLDPFIPQMDRF